MADIHVHVAEGEDSVFPEELIEQMLHEGRLTPETYYWREGMSEWKRLSTFRSSIATFVPQRRTDPLPDPATRFRRVQDPPAPREPGSPVSTRRYRFRRNPEPLTTILQVLLMCILLVTSLELAFSALRFNQLWSGSPAGAPSIDQDLAQVIGWMGLGLNLPLLLLYCMWIYRTNLNCHNFSSSTTLSPRWAVGCHFVPVMNLVRPYQVLQEIWKVSSSPRNWQNEPSSILVGVWWALWLLLLGSMQVYSLLSDETDTHAGQVNAALALMGLNVLQLVWYGTFLAMVNLILQRQTRLVKPTPGPKKKKAAAQENLPGLDSDADPS